jgi:hypothetical protein
MILLSPIVKVFAALVLSIASFMPIVKAGDISQSMQSRATGKISFVKT